MSGVRIGESWTFKAEGVATQTFGILAVRGAGKSNLAAVMAEEMHRLRMPFVVVDPVGSWWGLRGSADGKSPGLDVPIFGGRHGDVPLEKTGGQVLADLVVDDRVSCVLDISEFSETDKIHFLIDFAERLYRRNTEPLHLFLEEADDYCPQRPMREQARLLRAWENVVRRGRSRGLGMTMITQRSAALNKNVLTQIETLFVLRTTSPQDRKAIEGWIEYHGQAREVLETLPRLQAGEAWVWSPAWLQLMRRIQVRRRQTFDSAATPKESRGARPAATLANVDLAKVRERMAATIERAKQEDPRELRRRVAALERELAAARVQKPETKVETVERAVVKPAELARVEKLIERVEALADRATDAGAQLGAEIQKLTSAVAAAKPGPPSGPTSYSRRILPSRSPEQVLLNPPRVPQTALESLSSPGRGGLQRMLTALAQRPQGLSSQQLGIRAGLSSRSGTFDTYLSRARKAGWITGDRGLLRITDSGLHALGSFEPLPTGRELLGYWLSELGQGGASRMLGALADAHPRALDADALGAAAGLSQSGTFDTYLSRLRRLELVEGDRRALRLSEELVQP